MASNWGDFNGDGKTNYTDYKIYTTQIDPYSGEYQGQKRYSAHRQKGIDPEVFWLTILTLVLFLFFAGSGLSPTLSTVLLFGTVIVIYSVYLCIKANKNKKKLHALEKLDKLKEQGIITVEEYNKLKRDI